MSFQGNQREVDPLVGVGHEIPGADDGAQVVHLTQIQIAQIVSNAVSQALTHQIQQLGNSSLSATAANHVTQNTTAAQQFLNTHQVRCASIRGCQYIKLADVESESLVPG